MDLLQVSVAIQELECDDGTPKSIKSRLVGALKMLAEQCEDSIKISKVLSELESIADDAKAPVEVRMQILNLVSQLESF